MEPVERRPVGPSPKVVELFLGRLPPGVAERIFGFGFHLWMAKPKHFLGPAEHHSPFYVGGDVEAAMAQLSYEICRFPSTLDADVFRVEATMTGPNLALVKHLAWHTAPILGLRDVDANARFPIADRDGVERWLTWRHAGFDAYRERCWPKVPLEHSHRFVSPPPPLPDGRRRPAEVYLLDPQAFLRRDAPLHPVQMENNSWVGSDYDSLGEHTSDWESGGGSDGEYD